jgi:hypothetical protein
MNWLLTTSRNVYEECRKWMEYTGNANKCSHSDKTIREFIERLKKGRAQFYLD